MSAHDCPFGDDVKSYWDQRHALFSRFDDGVRIDRLGLYSVKPEVAALDVGMHLAGDLVLDGFAGVGGSAIGLARAGKRVVSVDVSRERLAMAAHNAALYGVADRIEFVHGDFFELLAARRYDAVYLDPPWGGLRYHQRARFPLDGFEPDGGRLLMACRQRSVAVAFSVPLSIDLAELATLRWPFALRFAYSGDEPIYSTLFFNSPATC